MIIIYRVRAIDHQRTHFTRLHGSHQYIHIGVDALAIIHGTFPIDGRTERTDGLVDGIHHHLHILVVASANDQSFSFILIQISCYLLDTRFQLGIAQFNRSAIQRRQQGQRNRTGLRRTMYKTLIGTGTG